VVRPADRKRVVDHLRDCHGVSERRACTLARISRKALRYQSQRPARNATLVCRLKALGEQYPRYSYLLHGMLRAEALDTNRKQTYRLYTEVGMQVHTKRRKKPRRPRLPMAVPTGSNESWSADFARDKLAETYVQHQDSGEVKRRPWLLYTTKFTRASR
jgi:putative transposase